ncbi:MAG TPA: glycosyltransferase 87 family protein [Gemmatimonadota bacterium]|nr:glycosyltransferase 87 family protein [Gemmatimonadota bacterium]
MWAAAGGAVALALALARFDPYLFTGGDNAHYYALARALATGRGYVDLVAPGAPLHVHYPPGYPLLLVPVYLASGGSYVALKAVSWLAAGGLLAALWTLARRDPRIPDWAAAAAVWTTGLYAVFQLYAHRVLSDMPYAALVAGSLAALQPAATGQGGRRPWVMAGALALAAFYVRSAGVTLLAGIVVFALLRRRWRAALASAAAFGVGVAPWFLWTRLAAESRGRGDYVGTLAHTPLIAGGDRGRVGEFAERLGDTALEYLTFQLPHLFWPTDPAPDPVRVAAVLLAVPLLAWGAWRLLRAGGPAPWELYLVASIALLPFWPWLGDRYFLTLAPFLWLWLLAGADAASRRFAGSPRPAGYAVALLAGFLLVSGGLAAARQWDRTRAWLAGDEWAGYSAFWADYFRAARWIGDHAPEDAVVLARKPTLAWYFSGRPAVEPPRRRDPEARWTRIRELGVTHLLLEPATEEELRDVLHPRVDRILVAHETPRREVVVLALPPGDE